MTYQPEKMGIPMGAGRELDAQVRAAVWRQKVVWQHGSPMAYTPKDADGWETYNEVPRYSTEIIAAWKVMEKIGGWFHLAHFISFTPPLWRASFDKDDAKSFGEADTAPHAICLAALKTCTVTSRDTPSSGSPE